MPLSDNISTNPGEYARVIEWTAPWEPGAPTPQVFSNGHKVYLIYLAADPEPDWREPNPTSFDNAKETLALVEFSGHTFRFGIANEEVFSGLPLWGKGLEGYEAHIIENSAWMEEIKSINKVHPYYSEERWKNKRHYALLFHDEILEVIATSYTIETFQTTFEELASVVAKRMNC